MPWHLLVWIAALLVPLNYGFFVLLLMFVSLALSIGLDLSYSIVFVILFGHSHWLICGHRCLRVGYSGVGRIVFTAVDACFDIPKLLAIVVVLCLLAMVNKLVSRHRFLVEGDFHGVGHAIRFSHTLCSILLLIFL